MRLISLGLSALLASAAFLTPTSTQAATNDGVKEGTCSGDVCVQERCYGTMCYVYEVTYSWFPGFGWVAVSEKVIRVYDTRDFRIEQ